MNYSEHNYPMSRFPDEENVSQSVPEICPLSGLPLCIAGAVSEVHEKVKAPLPLVIASALGAISLACQDEIDVESGSGEIGPCSLFFMTIAESGDRKSTVDRIFTRSIIEFEDKKTKEYDKQIILHKSAMKAWLHGEKILMSTMKKSDNVGSLYEQLTISLQEHNKIKPLEPIRQKLIYSNATPESIVHGMYRNWPSAGIMSDEAGGILNGQAMNDLAMLNQLWDGSTLTVDRKTTESFSLRNARLTISLMTQESSLRKFIERRDSIARGIGFLARCLIAKPQSMQGNRLLNDESDIFTYEFEIKDKYLKAFKVRLDSILANSSEARLQPGYRRKVLKLSNGAKKSWFDFYNFIEKKLTLSGEFSSVKDAASKIAENAVRMAAVFHFFEGRSGDISKESMDSAVITCQIYINNFKNLFGMYGYFSEDRRDVDKLVGWLKTTIRPEFAGDQIKKNDVLKWGPLRNIYELDKAINYLESQNALKKYDHEKTAWIQLIRNHPMFFQKA